MRHLGLGVALAAIVLPAAASAQSVFDGRWRVDLGSTQIPKKPWVLTLNKTGYRCVSCSTPWGIPADGGFHRVAGQNYFDEAALKQIDPRTVEFHYRKGGRLVETDRISVSADGKTLTSVDTDLATANGQPAIYRSTARRSAAGAPGSHVLGGSWVTTSFDKGSDNTMTVTMRLEGDRFSFADGTGSHYVATFGGPAVKVEGDIAGRMIAASRLGAHAIQLDSSIGGKADSRMIVTVAPDGKKMTVESTNLKQGTTARFVAYKQ
ncbi:MULTISPECIES: hypothetical protein [unclassified Sphingomonas]|uniref:hypothetical protein n=1 Tax=unclassified Sphingomonas TaxID=196159 RepID=UPI000A724CF8|nr:MULTISPECIES: hypothetical protein [unclassified Sphingomonas]